MRAVDIDELLGVTDSGPAKKPARRRRKGATPAEDVPSLETVDFSDLGDSPAGVRQHAIKLAGSGRAFIDAGVLRRPVSKNFLALLFDMDPATVTKRLLRCPELGKAGGGRPMYDFREAVAFLLPPRMDIEEYVNSIDPDDLPTHINKAVWSAKRERLRYMIEAGDAWPTEAVLEVFGLVFMTIKDRMQLWTETLRDVGLLSDQQYAKLMQMVDDLQGDLHEHLIAIPKQRKSFSIAVDGDAAIDRAGAAKA